MPVIKIKYQHEEIVYVDYRLQTQVEMDKVLDDSLKAVKGVAETGVKVSVLVDVRGVPITSEFINKQMREAKAYVPFIQKSAILGITGVKRLFFEMYLLFTNSKMRAFDTKEDALAYLAGGKLVKRDVSSEQEEIIK